MTYQKYREKYVLGAKLHPRIAKGLDATLVRFDLDGVRFLGAQQPSQPQSDEGKYAGYDHKDPDEIIV